MGEVVFQLDKRAGFVEDALKTIKDKSHLIDSPFETIFSVIGPMIPRSNILKMVLFLAEAAGYGPGLIGKFIDNMLGLGTKEALGNLSNENLKEVSTITIDKFLENIGIESQSMMEDIYMIKGSFDLHDLISVLAYVKYNNIKSAAPGRILNLRNFFRRVGRGGRLPLIDALFSFLRTFVKGLIGLGIAGGVVGKTKELLQQPGTSDNSGDFKSWMSPSERGTKSVQFGRRGPTDLYLNTRKDVEDTLINFLDSKYKMRSKSGINYITFSKMFQELNGYSLKGSKEMQDVLKLVDALNWGDLSQINEKRTFVGPVLETVAKKLIPVMQLESSESKNTENKELLQALQGVYK